MLASIASIASTPSPLYCSLCACPCLVPRLALLSPHHEPALAGTDTIDTISRTPWLRAWHAVQVAHGVVASTALERYNAQRQREFGNGDVLSSGLPNVKRVVPVHDYCLRAVLATVRKSMYNCEFSHEEHMILGWSVPRWTGWGPWELGGSHEPKAGHWKGSPEMIQRWKQTGGGLEGSHLVPADLADPSMIGTPTASSPISPSPATPRQTGKLALLPEPVLILIIHAILGDPVLDDDQHRIEPGFTGDTTPLIPETAVVSFESFRQTCVRHRDLELGTALWRTVTLHSVQSYAGRVLARWRTNPTGVGSIAQLWASLDEQFMVPVKNALACASREVPWGNISDPGDASEANSHGDGYMASDVWTWWKYSDGWRSRRRVWSAVVHATATARDADWW